MKEQIEKIKEFHKAFKLEETQNYAKNYRCFQLRHKLQTEENEEYYAACCNDDAVEIADALGDQLYVLLGTIVAHGLEPKIEEIFAEIHRSNMSKLENGEPKYRDDGKVLKGKDYFKPNLKKILKDGNNNGK